MENEPTVRIKFLQEYEELFNPIWRTLVYYGGRGSGKSQHVALALILRGRDTKLRILCTRELQNTIADSVHKLLSDIINKNGFTDYEITEKSIRNKLSGTEFIFKGLRHNSTEIKSTEGIDIAWVEEAQSISEDSLKLLVPTIRKPGSQLIFTFNRMYELDPVYVRYVLNERPRTYVRKVNYDVLYNAGLLPDELYEEMLADKAVSYGLYAHVWLGEPVSQADNAIIGRESIMKAMEREIDPVGAIEVGVDVARMGNDRTVFMKRKGMKKIDEKIYSKLRTDEVADMLEEFVEFDRSVIIKIDDSGVGGGVTDQMMRRGYRVVPINFGQSANDPDRYPNMISEGWFYLASIMDEMDIELDNDLLMELSTRQWKMDSKGRRVVESKVEYKKRGFRSPDKADALILCYYNVVPGEFEERDDSDDDFEPITSGLLSSRF
ncbi:PBSX family phage terminase large subunit [Glutamicibacter halophytocola]|uniref:PBSX family phage terminase large subunit n=1 Tax=Glutamicibacter halophytocola TaxID=1933880 RepID=UPI0015C5685E|nr:PBSX family phage terminase large subunit [Glutamicibacter halophytocola]NQD39982.1 PBSX family phage terminase large subunit [Glutamicibacter halophytocola]